MPKLRRVSGQEVVRAMERLGFVQVRQRGSHVVLKKQTPEGDTGCVAPRIGNWNLEGDSAAGQSNPRRLYGQPVKLRHRTLGNKGFGPLKTHFLDLFAFEKTWANKNDHQNH